VTQFPVSLRVLPFSEVSPKPQNPKFQSQSQPIDPIISQFS
jgi:hypothetical protein